MILSSVYPHDVNKIEKKERTKAELHEVIEWLTGFVEQTIDDLIDEEVTFEDSESNRDSGEDVDVVGIPGQPAISSPYANWMPVTPARTRKPTRNTSGTEIKRPHVEYGRRRRIMTPPRMPKTTARPRATAKAITALK